jgi:hypothetical protein
MIQKINIRKNKHCDAYFEIDHSYFNFKKLHQLNSTFGSKMLRKQFQKMKQVFFFSTKVPSIGIRKEDKNWYERR